MTKIKSALKNKTMAKRVEYLKEGLDKYSTIVEHVMLRNERHRLPKFINQELDKIQQTINNCIRRLDPY